MPNAAIIIASDFNRLNIKQIANQFHLKQLVKFPTRGERTLDLILTNLEKILPKPGKRTTLWIIRPFYSYHFSERTVRPRSTDTKKLITVRKRNKTSVDALGRFLSNIDWSMLNSLVTIENQLNYFKDTVMIGLNSMMPSKLVKLHTDDTPWVTPYFKDLIRIRQKALKENNIPLFKLYRNRVNRKRKKLKSSYYNNKVKHLKEGFQGTWPR